MNSGAQIFLVVLAALILLAAAAQVWQYRARRSLITPPQLALRLTMSLLLLAVVGLTAWGLSVHTAAGVEMTRDEQILLLRSVTIYWTLVILLVVAAAILALFDLRYLRAAQHRARAALYRRMAELQQQVREQARQRAQEQEETQQALRKSAPDN